MKTYIYGQAGLFGSATLQSVFSGKMQFLLLQDTQKTENNILMLINKKPIILLYECNTHITHIIPLLEIGIRLATDPHNLRWQGLSFGRWKICPNHHLPFLLEPIKYPLIAGRNSHLFTNMYMLCICIFVGTFSYMKIM